MKIKQLKPHQMAWIQENEIIFRISLRLTQEKLVYLFNIYNSITGENKPVTSCGRCVEGVKKQVWGQFQKQQNQDETV